MTLPSSFVLYSGEGITPPGAAAAMSPGSALSPERSTALDMVVRAHLILDPTGTVKHRVLPGAGVCSIDGIDGMGKETDDN